MWKIKSQGGSMWKGKLESCLCLGRKWGKEMQVFVGVFRETDRKGVSFLFVCVCPWGITYHINNMTECPASSPISCQSSTFSQQYLTLNSETTPVEFKPAAPVWNSLMYIYEHSFGGLYPHGSHLQPFPHRHFQLHTGGVHFNLITLCKTATGE